MTRAEAPQFGWPNGKNKPELNWKIWNKFGGRRKKTRARLPKGSIEKGGRERGDRMLRGQGNGATAKTL